MFESMPAPTISATATLGQSVQIWAGSQIRERVSIGPRTSIGQYCYVGPGVEIGSDCKIQNHALIYEPANIGQGVFIGPGVIITNDVNPRAVTSEFVPKTPMDWTAQAAQIGNGASLGAGVICVGPVNVGPWAVIGAGSVVTNDVRAYALVVGVPGRQIGWVGESGHRLVAVGEHLYECTSTGRKYAENADGDLIRA